MRKLNAVLIMIILVLFLIHGVMGAFQLTGVGSTALKIIARIAVALTLAHVVIGIKLTADTIRIQRKAGAYYYKENKLFWARRISGLAVMVLLFFHFTSFGTYRGEAYRLREFDTGRLISQILLVVAIAFHVITNVRPMMLALGIKSLKKWVLDIVLILSIVLLFMAFAFIIYYLRWSAV